MFKFVEQPESNEKLPLDQKSRDKFKIMSLKVVADIDYVPELVSCWLLLVEMCYFASLYVY